MEVDAGRCVVSTFETRFKHDEVAVVLGDGADWCHEVPPLHEVRILHQLADPAADYPEFLIDDKDDLEVSCGVGYKVMLMPCNCGRCPQIDPIWDVALVDLVSPFKPVTEEELTEVYEILGVPERGEEDGRRKN